jgi:RNA polymerase sigma factor (sigma-70 family)
VTAGSTGRQMPRIEPYRDIESLVRATHDQLTGFAFRLLGNRADAQDCVQTALLNVFRKWASVGSFGTFSQQRAYLYTAVAREVLQLNRKSFRRSELLGIAVTEAGYSPDYFDEHRQKARDDLRFVWQVINELPTGCREVTILFAAGYENREIAERLNVSRSTVRSHLGTARRKLRQAVPGSREDGLP